LFSLDILTIFNYLEDRIFVVLKWKVIFLRYKDSFSLERERKKLPDIDPSNLPTQLLALPYRLLLDVVSDGSRTTLTTWRSSLVPKKTSLLPQPPRQPECPFPATRESETISLSSS